MKAAVFYQANTPLIIEEVPVPEIGEEELLLAVKSCGICHTDLSMFKGAYFPRKKPPIIFGHEIAGEVVKAGSQVKDYEIGDRVIVMPNGSCGECFFCKNGRINLCDNLNTIGIDSNGGFAEYVKVPGNSVFRLPDFLSFAEGSLICDSIATPFHALQRAQLKKGSTVAIIGVGGLGLNAIQLASSLFQANIIALDIVDQKLERAKKFGALYTVNVNRDDVTSSIKEYTGGKGVDYSFEFVGLPDTYSLALEITRKGGKVVFVGAGNFDFMVNASRLFKEELILMGSYGVTRQDFLSLIQIIKEKKIIIKDLPTQSVGLDEINKGFEILDKGETYPTRVIVKI